MNDAPWSEEVQAVLRLVQRSCDYRLLLPQAHARLEILCRSRVGSRGDGRRLCREQG